MIAGSGAFVAVVDPWLTVDPVKLTGNFSGFREYEPADAPPVAELQKRIAERWRNEECSVTRHADGEEIVVDRFNVECERGGVLPLPVYATSFIGWKCRHLIANNRASSCPTLRRSAA